MLECFHKLEKIFAVGRKRMCHLATLIFFVQQAGVNQRSGMLGNGFEISLKLIGNSLNRDPFVFLDG